MQILTRRDSCITGEIVDLLPLSQSTVSQHLAELKKIGLVQGEIDGPRTCYCIDQKRLELVKASFNKLFTHICKC